MCCRFFIGESDPELAPVLDAAQRSPLLPRFRKAHPAPLVRAGEVRPADLVAAVASDRRRKAAVFPMVWGFTIPGRSAPLVNARVETAAEKPSFRDAWQSHRCAIPASWYYEWQHLPSPDGKRTISAKYAIQPQNASVTWLCGLYRIENGFPVFVILTREPSPDIVHIHDRMPLMLPGSSVRDWINPDIDPAAILPLAVTRLTAERAET